MRFFIIGLFSVLCFVQGLHAQSNQFELPLKGFQADDSVPTTKQVFGYDWGDEISNHAQVALYLKKLHEACPERTDLIKYGKSYENRSLNYLVISSPDNISRLDEIRENNLRLADPRICDPVEAKALIEKTPAIVWLAYCVHGNEISPSDAALLTAYHLLADQTEATKKWLQNLVVIIDPLQNPDGRDRFVNVFRETRGLFNQSNPYSNEHAERWPSGRSNHYWFDMNRDWFRHSQQEVKAKVAAYLDWQPQMYVDAHEMGRNSTYYFPPPADPKNPYLLESQADWFSKLGKHQGKWFDRFGFGYVTREIFDAFYPGYGSEWPTLQGGMGILWEQASARGQVIERDDDTELTYRNGVRNHYVSGISTIEFAATNQDPLQQSFYDSKSRAVDLGKNGDVRHYFISRNRPQRTDRFVSMLRRNGIEVRSLNETTTVDVTDLQTGKESTVKLAPGTYHIPVAQPAARLLRAIMDRDIQMDEKFLRRQLERNQLRLRTEIYDVTAWSMPLAFDIDCKTCSKSIEVKSTSWNPVDMAVVQTDLPTAKVAYAVAGTDGAMRALADWIQQGVRVHVNDESFTIGGRKYPPGTLILKVAGNDGELNHRIQGAMRSSGIEDIVALDSSYVDEGAHMGGPDVRYVKPPKVLLVVNRPTNYSSGHTWHLFDHVLRYPTTRVNGRDFASMDLSKFNTIVMPDGRYSSNSGFGESTSRKLKEWVSAGGTLITMRGATAWAADEKNNLIENRLVKRKIEAPKTNNEHLKEDEKKEQEKMSPDSVPGAFFNASVFNRHWVTYGYESDLNVFYAGNIFLTPTRETGGRSLVTFVEKGSCLSSGFCWPKTLEIMAETPYAVHRRMGRGNIVAFADDPNFRAMYPSLQRLFINAVMFGASH